MRGSKPLPGHADPDAMVWLYDYTGKLLAMNDDASDSTLDAHVHLTLPASNTYDYVYLRDYDLHSETFSVRVDGGHGGTAVADAERAYEAVADRLDSLVIAATALPAGAKALYDRWTTLPHDHIFAYRLSAALYAVALHPEEEWLVDLFSADGTLLVHGWNGDGDRVPTGWGSYPSWDPTR